MSSQIINCSPFNNFLLKGKDLSTAVTQFLTPKELAIISRVSTIMQDQAHYQGALLIKPELRNSNHILKRLAKEPASRVKQITQDVSGRRYVQRIFREQLNYSFSAHTLNDKSLPSTPSQIISLMQHLKKQKDTNPEGFQNLNNDQKFALEHYRNISEISNLSSFQLQAIALFSFLTQENLLSYPSFTRSHLYALEQGRQHEEIIGLTESQALALAKNLHLKKEHVKHLWFTHNHEYALSRGRKYEEIKELTSVQALALGNNPNLNRKHVDHKWFTYTHEYALKRGRQYKDIKELSQEQALELGINLTSTREEIIKAG